MGVFALCGLLVTLGWGGNDRCSGLASRLWTSKKVRYSTDASTSMSEDESRGEARAFRPATLSFRDERAR
jgi:hypothetical protein